MKELLEAAIAKWLGLSLLKKALLIIVMSALLGILIFGIIGLSLDKYFIRNGSPEVLWSLLGMAVFFNSFFALDLILRKNQELEQMAQVDPLTGLCNRRSLFDKGRIVMAQVKRHSERIYVVFIDMDNLKTINDTYTHEAGSMALQALASRLRESVHRDCDLLARYGGDEFVIVFTATDPELSKVLLERITEACKKFSFIFKGTWIDCSATVGYSESPVTDDMTLQKIVSKADIAMYENKRARKKAGG